MTKIARQHARIAGMAHARKPAGPGGARLGRLLVAGLTFALIGCAEGRDPIGPPDPAPLLVPSPDLYSSVVAGASHTCALRLDGVVNCWGSNFLGQAPATRAAAAGVFTAVSAFALHTCALRTDGAVECWGDNSAGQAPPLVAPPSGRIFVGVAAGGLHTCALRDDGVVQCWGRDQFGQAPATRAATSGTFTAVSTGGEHSCGLTSAGIIECWGWNEYRQSPETMAASIGQFVAVFTGQISTCGIRSDGGIECVVRENAPLDGAYTWLALHLKHGCAVRNDGVVACFGENLEGQAPETRTAMTGSFVKVAVGFEHTCALRTDSRIECWGDALGAAVVTVLPTATFSAPASVIVGQDIVLGLSDAQVPGYPSATSFSYAFDCGNGTLTPAALPSASCPTTTPGTYTVRGQVIDEHFHSSTYSSMVVVKSAEEGTVDLATDVAAEALGPDLRKSLLAKLNSALNAIENGQIEDACGALGAFINQVMAQRGKAIPEATADEWILTATQLQTSIGC